MVLTEAELGYLAGLVDSEGCINITCQQKRYYVLQVKRNRHGKAND